eukprot:jgi/Botrbrau1/2030/Bobra.0047s0012.3
MVYCQHCSLNVIPPLEVYVKIISNVFNSSGLVRCLIFVASVLTCLSFKAMGLSTADKALIRLFMAATFHHWKVLPELARSCYKAGAKVAEVRGCIRHLIVVSGYGPCLAATNHLHAAQLLAEDTPGKIQGEPGNAFELVYGDVTAAVRKKLHMVDPVLAEYIRLHLYGDIYSSPGLDLRQKQLLMVAFLAEADMHEQLFGHLIAAMKFHVTKEECLKSIDIGFELSPRVASEAQNMVYKSALKTLELVRPEVRSLIGLYRFQASLLIYVRHCRHTVKLRRTIPMASQTCHLCQFQIPNV